MKTQFTVEGMTCAHCVARVGNALKAAGAKAVRVDLAKGLAEVEAGSVAEQEARDAIAEAGYTVTGVSEAPGFSLFRR